MRALARLAARLGRAATGLALFVILANVALVLALFGPAEGAARLGEDWRRIVVARHMAQGRLGVHQAFAELYGAELGAAPTPAQIRAYVSRDVEVDEPAVFDVVLARYILARFGAIDGRTLPPGVYLAAGPIGPDAWPGPILTQYLVFPRHGYLLVVPPQRAGRWPRAYAATASLRQEFRRDGEADALYAAVQDYRPRAYDFPTAGEPLHDLLLIAEAPHEIAGIEQRLRAFSRTLDKQGLPYRLFRQNSNSALACYLQATGLRGNVSERVRSRLLLRLRLPGIAGGGQPPC